MTDYDPTYYARRAEEAQRLAERAMDPGVRLIHSEMASRYAELASRARPVLHLVSPALTAEQVSDQPPPAYGGPHHSS